MHAPPTDLLDPIVDVDLATRNFQQRQSDVFSSLASLEVAHKEVTKATKEERKAVRKAAWRHIVPVPEDLAVEKERRIRGETSQKAQLAEAVPEFRKPQIPRIRRRQERQVWRDPNKWTHYSLADVDEDGACGPNGDPNLSIASAFITEVRERRSSTDKDNEKAYDPRGFNEHRLLFRPVRGTKRAKLEFEESTLPSQNTVPAGIDGEDSVICPEAECSVSSDRGGIDAGVFIPRYHRRQIRSRISEGVADSPPHSEVDQSVDIRDKIGDNNGDLAEVNKEVDFAS